MVENRVEDHGRRGAGKRQRARRHLVDHDAEGKEIRPLVGLVSPGLFRRHVGHRAEHDPGRRPVGVGDLGGHRGIGGLGLEAVSCQTEVEQPGTALGQRDVGGFEVAVDDPLPVRGVEGIGDLDGNPDRLVDGQRALREPLGQRVALQVLHHQVVDPVLGADVEDGADMGVTQGRQRLGFPLEPLPAFGILGEVLGQDLDGDGAIKTGVAGSIDFAHAAGADPGDDFIGTEACAGSQEHGWARL